MRNNPTVMGFDFGTQKIGVAIGETLTARAESLCCVEAEKGVPSWESLDHLLKTWQPAALIVGKPLGLDGQIQPITLLADAFAKKLNQRYGLPVYCIDESLSTVEARAELFKQGGYRALSKKNIDAKAAQIILQEWLDTCHRSLSSSLSSSKNTLKNTFPIDPDTEEKTS